MNEEQSKPVTEPKTEGPNAAEQSQLQEWLIPEEGVHEVYADWYNVNWLPLVVRIRFAQIIPDPRTSPAKGSGWVLDERAALTMPWITVKTLAEMLTTLVNAYEKQNGEIVAPTMPVL